LFVFLLNIKEPNILNSMFGTKIYFNSLNVLWGTFFALSVTVLNIGILLSLMLLKILNDDWRK
jgi:hypothetical protein